ncbi:hypothetical protein ACFL4T_09485 [candidate division KSB1 bacterium]
MSINYLNPLSNAFSRMKTALFKPFDIKKWFVLGFTAFLAGLTDWPHGGGDNSPRGHGRLSDFDIWDILEFPAIAWEWLVDHPGWFMLITFGIVFITGMIILLNWLSSRGKFMFLDNVIHNKAEVVKPWKDFKSLGNSLFFWRLLFGIVSFLLIAGILVLGFIAMLIANDGYFPRHPSLGPILGFVLFFISVIFVVVFVSMLLENFVIPIMYRNNVKVLKAWGIFLPLLSRKLIHFILYGILLFILYIFIIIGVIIVGLFTCCIGFLLLIIPYIGSVIMLPVSYTFRSFSLEFLEQFGPDFTIFPKEEVTAVDTAE